MLIEYIVFAALVIVALAATFVGIGRRRTEMLSGNVATTTPYIDSGSASADGTHQPGHSELSGSIDEGGGAHFGGFDGGGGSHGGGGFDGGGGHND